ncbi:MAG: hypothetical protein ACRCVW_01210 [Brevinema sp.]
MRILLLIILLFGACADKQTKSKSAEMEAIETNSEPIIARYGIEPELFWIKKYNMASIEDEFQMMRASTIYYEPISNEYYYATIEKTNNISYDTNNIQDEKPHIEYNPSWYTCNGEIVKLEDTLTYIGSLDFFHRVYINTNGQQYLKKLSQIDTSYYMDFTERKFLTKKNPLTPLITNVNEYDPVYKEYFFTDGCTVFRLLDTGFKALYKQDHCL